MTAVGGFLKSEVVLQKFVGGRVYTRPDYRGQFDELIATRCDVHMEMMDDNTLWIALRPKGRKDEVHVTVSARGKLKITAFDAG